MVIVNSTKRAQPARVSQVYLSWFFIGYWILKRGAFLCTLIFYTTIKERICHYK